MRLAVLSFSAALGATLAAPAPAQDAAKEIQRYRQMVAEGSPAELFELDGEALWKKPQGPKNVSLERCDLGDGPGVLKGAYAHLPRYFKDADRVMDLETRLLHCMTTLQGRTREEATQRVFGSADRPSEFESLSAYIAGQSRGAKIEPGMAHAKERRPTSLAVRSTCSASAPGTSPARAVTAMKASASACRSCPYCRSRRRRAPSWPAGRRIASRQASSSPCSGA